MLIPFEKVVALLAQQNISVDGVLHVGAHECEELDAYECCGVNRENVIWVEAMRSKVFENRKKNIPNIVEGVVDECAGRILSFKRTNNGQSSSILPLQTHKKHYPHIVVVEEQTRETTTIDRLLSHPSLAAKKRLLNFWNLDIQGAELRALHGAEKHLKWADAIYTEVNAEPLYENCALLPDMDSFLGTLGFVRVETRLVSQGWGDALYIRAPLSKIPRSFLNNCDPISNGEHCFWQFLSHTGRANNCVIDVGAGTDTAAIVTKFPLVCRKHLFEPHPKFFSQLCEKIGNMCESERSNILLHNIGVASEPATLRYYEQWQSFVKRTARGYVSKAVLDLSAKPLDSLSYLNKEKCIDLMKIDTEGYELDVLRGSVKLLKRCAIVQFEYGGTYPDRGITLRQVVDFLTENGFTNFYILGKEGYARVNTRDTMLDEHMQYSNYVAAREKLPFIAARNDRNKAAVASRSSSLESTVFGKVLCINLDFRTERFEQFQKSFSDCGIDGSIIERVSAIHTPNQGWIGCARSHISALKKAIAADYERVTICEDDFVWKEVIGSTKIPQRIHDTLEKLEQKENAKWDVFLLASRLTNRRETKVINVVRTLCAFTASGYIVRRHYYHNLLRNFEQAEKLLTQHVPTKKEYCGSRHSFALDQYWHRLQEVNSWYCCEPTLGRQSSGASDIMDCEYEHTYDQK